MTALNMEFGIPGIAYRLRGFAMVEDLWAQIRDGVEQPDKRALRQIDIEYTAPMLRSWSFDSQGAQWWSKIEIASARTYEGIEGREAISCTLASGRPISIHQSLPGEHAAWFPLSLSSRTIPSYVNEMVRSPDPAHLADDYDLRTPSHLEASSFVLPPALYELVKYWCKKSGAFGGRVAMIPIPYAAFLIGKTEGAIHKGVFTMNGLPGKFCWGHYTWGSGSELIELFKHRAHFHHDSDCRGPAFTWDSSPLEDDIPVLKAAVDEWAERMAQPGTPADVGYRQSKLNLSLTNSLLQTQGWIFPRNYLTHYQWQSIRLEQNHVHLGETHSARCWYQGAERARRARLDLQAVFGVKVTPHGVRLSHGSGLDSGGYAPLAPRVTGCRATLQHFLRALEVQYLIYNYGFANLSTPVDLDTGYEKWWLRVGGYKAWRANLAGQVYNRLNTDDPYYQVLSWTTNSKPGTPIDLDFIEKRVQTPVDQIPSWFRLQQRTHYDTLLPEEKVFWWATRHYAITHRWLHGSGQLIRALASLVFADWLRTNLGPDPLVGSFTPGCPLSTAEVRVLIDKYLGPVRRKIVTVWNEEEFPPRSPFNKDDLPPLGEARPSYQSGQGLIRSLYPIAPRAVAPGTWESGTLPGYETLEIQRFVFRPEALPSWETLEASTEPPVPETDEETLVCEVCKCDDRDPDDMTPCSHCNRIVCDGCMRICHHSRCNSETCTECDTGGRCTTCDYWFCEDHIHQCEDCDTRVCSDHRRVCVHCENVTICRDCSTDRGGMCEHCYNNTSTCERCDMVRDDAEMRGCVSCNESVCSGCRVRCDNCREWICDSCVSNDGLCTECQEAADAEPEEEEDEERFEEETDESVTETAD